MPPRHILIVNARNVTQPVFVIGAPHSGAEAVGRALKISPGFHLTIGQQPVLQAVYGFARRPSLYNGRGEAGARESPPSPRGLAWTPLRSAVRPPASRRPRWGRAWSSAACPGSAMP